MQDPSTYANLASASGMVKSISTFTEFPRLDASINRLAGYLTGDLEPLDPGVVSARVASILDIVGTDLPEGVSSLILERLLEAMLQRATKRDALEIAFLSGQKLVDLLPGNESALRRIRYVFLAITLVRLPVKLTVY